MNFLKYIVHIIKQDHSSHVDMSKHRTHTTLYEDLCM